MDERIELLQAHKRTQNKKLAYRLNALILLKKGYTLEEVSDALLVDEKTVRRWRDRYKENSGIPMEMTDT